MIRGRRGGGAVTDGKSREDRMNKVEEIIRTRRDAHQKLLRAGSKTYRAFPKMEKAAYAEGHLPSKTKELIAVGISVVTDCESCMEWHIRAAVRHGATREEVLEALDVAMEMGGGRATVPARFALEVMDHVFEDGSNF